MMLKIASLKFSSSTTLLISQPGSIVILNLKCKLTAYLKKDQFYFYDDSDSDDGGSNAIPTARGQIW